MWFIALGQEIERNSADSVLPAATSSNTLGKANFVLITKTPNRKRSLKTQMLVANTNNSSENEVSEQNVWSQNSFLKEVNSNFGMEKVNFPEKILIYKSQAYLAVHKGETILYVDFFMMAQIISTVNVDSYECLPDEVKIIRTLYEAETGDFKGIKNTIGFINVRGVQE